MSWIKGMINGFLERKRSKKSHARFARSWWLDDVLDVYSKKANIWRRILRSRMPPPRQLRREKIIRSPKSFKEHADIATMDHEWCPWIPGAPKAQLIGLSAQPGLSFMTDGVQCKLPLVSVRNNRTPGLDCLYYCLL